MAAPGITVLKNNVPWGPFTREQLDDGLERGDFTVKYLAHAPGLKEWLPLGEVIDYVDRSTHSGAGSLPPVPQTSELPPVPRDDEIEVKPPTILTPAPARPPVLPTSVDSKPSLPPPIETQNFVPELRQERKLEPAPLILRGMAFVIDGVILFAPLGMFFVLGALSIEIPAAIHHIPHQERIEEWDHLRQNMSRLFWLVFVAFGWFYLAGQECAPQRATLGKRWVGIKVTDMYGERISFLRATGRYAAKYLSALPCFLGFIMALFSSRNMALHDRFSGTRVVKK
jgi:uncharacterized RDD family membrane protein YckC